ncbi:MAG: hypothetical protein WBW53_04540 [Terriglobales bacterium]
MNTNKAAYWIALGVFALALNSEYHHGSFVPLHRAADFAGSALCRITTHAEHTLALAKLLAIDRGVNINSRGASTAAAEAVRDQGEMLQEQARDEAELVRDQLRDHVRAQADMIRAQTEIQRAQIERTQWRVRSQVRLADWANRGVMVLCPKQGIRIAIDNALSSESTW